MLINVQYSDSTDAGVIVYFGSPQSAAAYSNRRQIEVKGMNV